MKEAAIESELQRLHSRLFREAMRAWRPWFVLTLVGFGFQLLLILEAAPSRRESGRDFLVTALLLAGPCLGNAVRCLRIHFFCRRLRSLCERARGRPHPEVRAPLIGGSSLLAFGLFNGGCGVFLVAMCTALEFFAGELRPIHLGLIGCMVLVFLGSAGPPCLVEHRELLRDLGEELRAAVSDRGSGPPIREKERAGA